jgi:hypothetical protein
MAMIIGYLLIIIVYWIKYIRTINKLINDEHKIISGTSKAINH